MKVRELIIKMEDLKQLLHAIDQPLSTNAKLEIIKTLVLHISGATYHYKQKETIRRIARLLAKTLTPQEKAKFHEAFLHSSGNYIQLLKLYRDLQIDPNLATLSWLFESYALSTHSFSHKKVPQFSIDLDSIDLASCKHPHGAVYVVNLPANPSYLQYFNNTLLNEKNIKPHHRYLIPLWRRVLGIKDSELVTSTFIAFISRVLKRTANLLEEIGIALQLIGCDLTQCATDLIFNSLNDHLKKEERMKQALSLYKTVVEKCDNVGPVVERLISQKDINESQLGVNLRMILALPKKFDAKELATNYCLDMSWRVKSEEIRILIASCLDKFLDPGDPGILDFCNRNLTSAACINLYSKLAMNNPDVKYTGIPPLQIALALSLHIPSQPPQNVMNFLSDPNSAFYSLQNLNEEESLAVGRATWKGLRILPDNIHIAKKVISALLSSHTKVFTFIYTQLKEFGVTPVLFAALKEVASSPDSAKALNNNFRTVLKLMISNLSSLNTLENLIDTIYNPKIFSLKKLKILNKYKGDILDLLSSHHPDILQGIIPSDLSINFLRFLTSFELNYDLIENHIKYMDIQLFKELETLKKSLEDAFYDHRFEELTSLNQLCSELLTKVGAKPLGNEQETIRYSLLKAREGLVNKHLRYFQLINRVLREAHYVNPESTSLYVKIYIKEMPILLKGIKIPELRSCIIDLMYNFFKFSKTFSNIYSTLTVALTKMRLRIPNERYLKTVFKFTTDKLDISALNEGEASIVEKLIEWELTQPASKLRGSAIHLLTRLIYERKFSDFGKLKSLIIHLLNNYSTPAINNLFAPLLYIIEPSDWRYFLQHLLNYQPTSKRIVLDNLLQYEKMVPCSAWSTGTLWVALFDDIEEIATTAQDVLHKFNLRMEYEYIEDFILPALFSDNKDVQTQVAKCLAGLVELNTAWLDGVVKGAMSEFKNRNKYKLGSVMFLSKIIHLLKDYTIHITMFMLEAGMKEPSANLRAELLDVAIKIMNKYGVLYTNELFTLLQTSISSSHPEVRHAAVVLLGFLAQFFSPEDFRIEETIELLLKSLESPTASLCQTVSRCLPKLVSFRRHMIEGLIEAQMKRLFGNESIDQKRGAGYGLAAVVKGAGVKALVNMRILDSLEKVINNKKSTTAQKSGVLLAVEGLGSVLARGFEPYLGEVLPFIIENFSDANLQEQAANTTKILISKLTAHGMKRILPVLTHELDATKWRSKVGAIEALGKMAFCAPRQLSGCLPEIVPQVVKSFTDTNPQVLDAARKALADIGSVVTNPEIFQIVPILIKSLSDVSELKQGLKVLLETNFMHYMDAASLSLIIPIIEGGLRSRNGETKKMACQVIGGLTSVIRDYKEILPYIERLTTALKISLFDNIPEVRNIAAQNLGMLCSGVGSKNSHNILDWLEDIMQNSTNLVERAGSVHAFSEVIKFDNYWEGIVDRLASLCVDPNPIKRESYLGLFIYIPVYAKGRFEHHLERLFPIFLENLSHDSEEVRRISIRVMQLIIKEYCKAFMNMLLPPLENGLFNENWRTRASSIVLIGEMLERLVSLGRREGREYINEEMRTRILASVYVLRTDNTATVHVTAANIWKTMVDNTAKYVIQITPEIVSRLIRIADTNEPEKLSIALNSIQSLMYKYQERVFSEYLKYFANHFSSYPKGVGFILRVVCESANKKSISQYSQPIIDMLEQLLKSEDPIHLKYAGNIFNDIYNKTISNERSTLDQNSLPILLLNKIVEFPKGCRELLKFNNPGITSSLIPRIMASESRSIVLKEIADLIGDELFRMRELTGMFENILRMQENRGNVLEAIQIVVANLKEKDSIKYALETIEGKLTINDRIRIVHYFCEHTKVDYSPYIQRLIEIILPGLNVDDLETTSIIGPAFKLTIQKVDKEEVHRYFEVLKEKLNSCRVVPVFNQPKGLESFLPIFQNTLMYGTQETREMAARGYCDIIQLTDPKPLEGYAVNIAGPLIRVMSDRVEGDIKTGILDALYLLLQKASIKLKPFVAQLQTTFVKAINHSEQSVREAASRNLIELLKMRPRVDLLVSDLSSLKGNEEVVILSLKTLEEVIKNIEVQPQSKSSAANKLINELDQDTSPEVCIAAGKLLVSLSSHIPTTLSSIPLTKSGILLQSSFLAHTTPDYLAYAQDYFSQAINIDYKTTVQGLTYLVSNQSSEGYSFLKPLLSKISSDIEPALPLLIAVNPDDYCRDLDSLSEIFPAIVSLLANNVKNNGDTEALDQAICHIFKVAKTGIDNILRALHLLEGDLQAFFRNYAEDLI